MRYVTYCKKTGNIISASSGPAESHLQNLSKREFVGEAGDFNFEGARENYIFIPDTKQDKNSKIIKGSVLRKPEEEWDLEAEERVKDINKTAQRFHKLDIDDIKIITVYLIIPISFIQFTKDKESFNFSINNTDIEVNLIKRSGMKIDFMFDFGGHSVTLRYTEINFKISPKSCLLHQAIDDFINKFEHSDLFISRVIQAECLKISIIVANKIIESYRIIYDDPEARLIGIADAISGAMTIELSDGKSQNYLTGNPYSMKNETISLREKPSDTDKIKKMHELLKYNAPPFLQATVISLKSSHIYSNYRECVVWAGAIITNLIEDILLQNLTPESSEYKKIKFNSAKIKGKTKRGELFKVATGKTLNDFLTDVINNNKWHKDNEYWTNLPSNIEDVLNERNLLLHRKKAITSNDSDKAFFTCMNFIYAVQYGVPYSQLYSNDYNLTLSSEML